MFAESPTTSVVISGTSDVIYSLDLARQSAIKQSCVPCVLILGYWQRVISASAGDLLEYAGLTLDPVTNLIKADTTSNLQDQWILDAATKGEPGAERRPPQSANRLSIKQASCFAP